jgi:hypothetical protein
MRTKQVLLLAFVSVLLTGLVSAADPPPTEPAAAGTAPAQPAAEHDATELAKQTQNPVADLISLPLQNNTYFEVGPNGSTQNILLVQPVIPVSLNEDWNLINRPIIPIINQPAMTDDQNRHWSR